MVRGHVWKPQPDGKWHWQLIIREATAHAHAYSGWAETFGLAHAEMKLSYQQHHVLGTETTPRPMIVISGFDKNQAGLVM